MIEEARARRKAPATGYTTIDRRGFFGIVECLIPPSETVYVRAAYQLAKGAHRNQQRDCGRRYFDHPREVALILMSDLKVTDWKTIVVGLLHDSLEDSYLMSAWVMERIFGEEVALSLRRLSKDPKGGYFERLHMTGTSRDLLVKLVDRLHNLRTLKECPEEKQAPKIEETRLYILPLIEQLSRLLPREEQWRAEYLEKQIAAFCS